MNIMTAAACMAVASCALFSGSSPARADGPASQTTAALSSLSGTSVSNGQLSAMRGGAFTVISSSNTGTDSNNTANNSPTGNIVNNQAVNNNAGITTVFQNTGNNTLFQSSTTININVH